MNNSTNAPTIMVADPLRKSVEAASEGKCTVLYTKKGYPTYMTIVSAFNCEDISNDLGTGRHPAFVVDGIEKSEIFVGTYQAIIHDGQALSLPYQKPCTSITLHKAKAACMNAGPGFHLMTNWEWAAVGLWCAKNGFFPRGNTDYGMSHSHRDEVGLRCNNLELTLTGSGPAAWRHDGTVAGIADLAGNVWEWTDGIRMIDGLIKMPADNNYCQLEKEWPDTGTCIDGGVGQLRFSDAITERGYFSQPFRELKEKEGFDVPVAVKRALLFPCKLISGKHDAIGEFWFSNEGERAALRGGSFTSGAVAGVFALYLIDAPSNSPLSIGFRACKVL